MKPTESLVFERFQAFDLYNKIRHQNKYVLDKGDLWLGDRGFALDGVTVVFKSKSFYQFHGFGKWITDVLIEHFMGISFIKKSHAHALPRINLLPLLSLVRGQSCCLVQCPLLVWAHFDSVRLY